MTQILRPLAVGLGLTAVFGTILFVVQPAITILCVLLALHAGGYVIQPPTLAPALEVR